MWRSRLTTTSATSSGAIFQSAPLASSPLENAVGREAMERYDAALAQLPEEQQEAVILRVEMGYTYVEISELMGRISPDAARMAVTRALVRLSRLMRAGDKQR